MITKKKQQININYDIQIFPITSMLKNEIENKSIQFKTQQKQLELT